MKRNTDVLCFLISLVSLLGCISSARALEIDKVSFAGTSFKVGAGQPFISVCDFNSDGSQDVIIANYSDNNLIAYQGNNQGSLKEVGRFSVGENPTGLAVSDINGDGNSDVVVANHETSYVTLLFGDGKGQFKQEPQSKFSLDINPHPHAVGLSDLDGDNRVDLIVDSRTDEGLLVLKGLANGKFKKPGTIVDVGGDPYRGFAVGDINGDRRPDLVTPNQREIGIVINTGTDKLSFSLYKLAQPDYPFAVELADMNGDGKMDLVVVGNASSISVIPGDGQGRFLENKKTLIKASAGAKQIAIGDINGDGIEDALVSNWSGEMLAVLGSKKAIQTTRFKHSKIPNPWGVALADLNADGKSDIIIADGNSEQALVYISKKN